MAKFEIESGLYGWVPAKIVYETDKYKVVEFESPEPCVVALYADEWDEALREVPDEPKSRCVPVDKRIDFTKPLEQVGAEDDYLGEVTFIGPVHEQARNFPSWFVCKNPFGWCFIVRGDGKTDVPGLTVRNKVSEERKKDFLPLKLGHFYRLANGKVCVASSSSGHSLNYVALHARNIEYLADVHIKTGTSFYSNPEYAVVEEVKSSEFFKDLYK